VIPEFDPNGRLPPGIHDASWAEVEARFGAPSARRRRLSAGLLAALTALKAAGCRVAYVDGSFVTEKEEPEDFDGCWETAGVEASRLDPVLLDFSAKRLAQKIKYQGEIFPADARPGRGLSCFLDFFRTDRDGNPKGIVRISLDALP